MFNWGIIQSICFFQADVSFTKIPTNFVLVIVMTCLLSYVMLIPETGLRLAVHCIKWALLKSTESKFASNHSSIGSETMLLSFQKSVIFGLETNMLQTK